MSGDEASSPETPTAGQTPAADRSPGVPVAEAMEDELPAIEVTGRREPNVGASGAAGALPEEAPSDRFRVEVPGHQGSLASLVVRAQRGDVDLAAVSVQSITSTYRRAVARADPPAEPREIADFLGLAARLLTLKAQQVIPDGPLDAPGDEASEEEEPADQPGRRLAEYRLFRAAADALLSEVAEEGTRSFLSLVAPVEIPVERLAIPPERLAAAFRAVLLRIDAREEVLTGIPPFSVDDKVTALRGLLGERGQVSFEDLFTSVGSRMEAVAVFLALLELLHQGGARVEQREPFGPITVSSLG